MPGLHELLQALFLGFIEGLTEFLPVSSTAHLLVAERGLGLGKDHWEVFTVVIQFGAVLAVVAGYWSKFWDVLTGLPTKPQARHFTLTVLIAFLPAVVLGLAFIHVINNFLLDPVRAMPVIATTWIVGGIIILVFERISPPPRYNDPDNLPYWKAFQIGICQCLALLPGVSRSGATILGGELLGVERSAATHFTFYLAVPTMFGASVLELYKYRHELTTSNLGVIAVGFVVSFLVAYVVVKTFVAFVSRFGLKPFGWYRILVGVGLLAMIAFRGW
jgi:undecaprenyl-diphosphatase